MKYLSNLIFGYYAEYVYTLYDGLVAIKAENIIYEKEVTIYLLLIRWSFLKIQANVQEGQKVLINDGSWSARAVIEQFGNI